MLVINKMDTEDADQKADELLELLEKRECKYAISAF